MSGFETFLYVVDAVIVPVNLILWYSNRHRRRFVDNMTLELWEASHKLDTWQRLGWVKFRDERLLERGRHLWKLCDDKDKEVVQGRLRTISGSNGYAIYNILLARRRFWQVL